MRLWRKAMVAVVAAGTFVALSPGQAWAIASPSTATWWNAPVTQTNPDGSYNGVGQDIYPGNDPVAKPGQVQPANFYALQTKLGPYSGATTGNVAYIGIQKDSRGKRAIFSVWNAASATCAPVTGAICRTFGGEGVGYQTIIPFNWSMGRAYHVMIKKDLNDCSLWHGYVIDGSTSHRIGSIKASATNTCSWVKGKATASFSEFYGPQAATCAEYPYVVVYFHPPKFYHSAGLSRRYYSYNGTGVGGVNGTGCRVSVVVTPAPWHRHIRGS